MFLSFCCLHPPFLWGCRNLISINLASLLLSFPGISLHFGGTGSARYWEGTSGPQDLLPPMLGSPQVSPSPSGLWLLVHQVGAESSLLLTLGSLHPASSQLLPGPIWGTKVLSVSVTQPCLSEISKRLTKIFLYFFTIGMKHASALCHANP